MTAHIWKPWVAGTLVALAACKGGDTRQASTGKTADAPFVKATTDDGATGTGGTAGTAGTGTAGTGTPATDEAVDSNSTESGDPAAQPNSKTLEECTDLKQAWRAVVNGGAQPADCGEGLVSWCCTRAEVDARFPTIREQIEAKFAEFIDTEGHVLYHCSTNGSNTTTFHLAKIVNGTVSYKTVFVNGVFPSDNPTPTNPCPVIKTDDLKKASLLLNDDDADRSAG